MHTSLRTLLPCLACCVGTATAWAQTIVAGAPSAQLEVSPMGVLVYTVPIAVPPGIGGMEPKLALEYSSHEGAGGHLGVGWSLGGLSMITRCPKTRSVDGVRRPVRYDATDSYCLDGKRLLLVAGAAEGVGGASYRLELDDASNIESWYDGNPAPWTGPSHWTVKTKSGLTLHFAEAGVSSDARIQLQGRNVTRAWALKRVTNTRGNYFTVSYGGSNANGEFYPVRIDYTGNGTVGAAPGNAVVFNYENLADVIPQYTQKLAYAAGSVFKATVRLKSVQTFASGSPVATVGLHYGAPVGPQRQSRIASVQVCDAASLCRQPLAFTYGADLADFEPAPVAYALPAVAAGYVTRNDAVGTFQAYLDLDGDGLSDMYYPAGSALYRGTRSGFDTTPRTWETPPGSVGYLRRQDATGTSVDLVDLNGDGLPDYYDSGNSAAWLNTGSGFASAIPWPLPLAAATGGYLRKADATGSYVELVDMNGDGLPDLYASGQSAVWLNNGAGFNATGVSWPAPSGVPAGGYFRRSDATGTSLDLVDLNGDGLPDLYFSGSSAAWLNTGTGFGAPVAWPMPAGANSGGYMRKKDADGTYLDLVDMNGDGLPDVYLAAQSAVWLNTGTGFEAQARSWAAATTGGYVSRSDTTGSWIALADANGDGMPDLLSTGQSSAKLSRGKGDRLLVQVAGGDTTLASIEYRTLSNPAVYLADSGSAAPLVDVHAPLYVVSRITHPDGIGGSQSRAYAYAGLKMDRSPSSDRGAVGFREVHATQLSTGNTTVTLFNQQWPFTGMSARTTLLQPIASAPCAGTWPCLADQQGRRQPLSKVSTTYGLTVGSAPPSRFVYAGQTVQETWDLNGTALPTLTTTYGYSQNPQYGDPTHIVVTNSSGGSKETVNEYWPADTAAGKWILSRLKRATVTSSQP